MGYYSCNAISYVYYPFVKLLQYKVYKIPRHLDVINWYMRWMRDEKIPEEAQPSPFQSPKCIF